MLRPITSHCIHPCAQQDYYHDFEPHNHVEGVLEIDPHISAAPVFFEVDEGRKLMIVPVSYFSTKPRR